MDEDDLEGKNEDDEELLPSDVLVNMAFGHQGSDEVCRAKEA
jgi:hypothetical protein